MIDRRREMYKVAVRTMIRRNIARLNRGDYGPALSMFASDATLTFPGDNAWSRQFRAPGTGRHASPTHRDRAEIEGFLRSFVALGLQLEIEDILVNGPPWNTRAAVIAHDHAPGPDGRDRYANRAVLYVRSRWGRIVAQEDFEDTQRAYEFGRLVYGTDVASSAAGRDEIGAASPSASP